MDIIQDVGGNEVLGAHWILEGLQRLGKATRSVVFFNQEVGTWEPYEVEEPLALIKAYKRQVVFYIVWVWVDTIYM